MPSDKFLDLHPVEVKDPDGKHFRRFSNLVTAAQHVVVNGGRILHEGQEVDKATARRIHLVASNCSDEVALRCARAEQLINEARGIFRAS